MSESDLRTDAQSVGEIITLDPNYPILPFMETANQLVTEICAKPGTLDDERLEMIERYLSAHFYTLRDPRPVTEQVGPIQETYQSKVDLFLCTSHYGQTAMMLDTTGGLKDLNNDMKTNRIKRKISVTWLGNQRESVYPGRRFCIPDNQ